MRSIEARTIEEAVAGAIAVLTRPVVLVVDADPASRARMSAWLESAGYEPVPVGDGRACLAELSRSHPAAVVLDLDLRGVSGTATLDMLRAAEPDLPVVAIAVARGRAADLLLHGADEFLVKPVGREPLSRALAAALRPAGAVGPVVRG